MSSPFPLESADRAPFGWSDRYPRARGGPTTYPYRPLSSPAKVFLLSFVMFTGELIAFTLVMGIVENRK